MLRTAPPATENALYVIYGLEGHSGTPMESIN